jgi:signal-transduction protein with cAMP-binding, CBS, and nucleotidyltransferase domain
MVTCKVAAIIIVDAAAKKMGIPTERDLARRVIARGLDPTITPIAEIMTTRANRLSIEYTNLKVGPVDSDLFKVPAGYQIMKMN